MELPARQTSFVSTAQGIFMNFTSAKDFSPGLKFLFCFDALGSLAAICYKRSCARELEQYGGAVGAIRRRWFDCGNAATETSNSIAWQSG